MRFIHMVGVLEPRAKSGWLFRRYAINDASADWSVAEAQVAKLGAGKQTVVSVKSAAVVSAGVKRKAEEDRGKDKKGGDKKAGAAGSRRSMKKAKR